ncbi:hypothetical protein [Methylomicrobium agile]|uniref:hypothetical protein n=1 Tax=Methylomicrobium agile TaxID=39774 RepID=UPI0004DFC336|nr:hypothetical protein [Methylomicrobium agile]
MSHSTLFVRIKWIMVLLVTMVLDISPVPVIGLILLYILLFRPLWFKNAVLEIYDRSGRDNRNGADDFE